jgi:hypothetical protein
VKHQNQYRQSVLQACSITETLSKRTPQHFHLD